jgi:hypothetical protein
MFKKNIDVYWASLADVSLDTLDPDSSFLDVIDRIKQMDPANKCPGDSINIARCPSVQEHLKNCFRIRSPLSFNIKWDSRHTPSFVSTMYDQTFFDKNVYLRDVNSGFVSFAFGQMLFVTEEPSLLLEQRHASHSVSNFCKNVSVVEGVFDVGKWFRAVDLAFFINNSNSLIDINRGDTLYYVKFHTKHKINLHKFHLDKEIDSILTNFLNKRHQLHGNNDDQNKLEKYYQYFKQSKYKKFMLKKIKQNVIE